MVRQSSQRLLLQAGVRALTTGALDGLRRVLAPVALETASTEADGPTVSRHSAYRLWPERDQAVAAVAQYVLNHAEAVQTQVEAALGAYRTATKDHHRRLPAAALGKDELRGIFRQVLAAHFHAQLGSDKRMAGWLLQIAATTCSPLWPQPPERGCADGLLGREILEARRRGNDVVIAEWTVLLRAAMALFGRRPRPGYCERDIVALMGCLFEGSLLRLFVDPDVVVLGGRPGVHEAALERAITRACDAMFELAWSCTQPGLLADPRRPENLDDPRVRAFDLMVTQAAVIYQSLAPREPLDPRKVASDAGQDPSLAQQLFPQPGDLPDSVLRHLVNQHAEPGDWDIDDTAPWITSTLRALSDIASTHPALIAATENLPPAVDAPGFIGELTVALAGLLTGSRRLHSDNPPEDARHLVLLVLQGPSGWYGARAALELAATRARRRPAVTR